MALTWRPPDDLHRQLRVEAAVVGRSVNSILTEAVRDWLARNQSPATVSVLANHPPLTHPTGRPPGRPAPVHFHPPTS